MLHNSDTSHSKKTHFKWLRGLLTHTHSDTQPPQLTMSALEEHTHHNYVASYQNNPLCSEQANQPQPAPAQLSGFSYARSLISAQDTLRFAPCWHYTTRCELERANDPLPSYSEGKGSAFAAYRSFSSSSQCKLILAVSEEAIYME